MNTRAGGKSNTRNAAGSGLGVVDKAPRSGVGVVDEDDPEVSGTAGLQKTHDPHGPREPGPDDSSRPAGHSATIDMVGCRSQDTPIRRSNDATIPHVAMREGHLRRSDSYGRCIARHCTVSASIGIDHINSRGGAVPRSRPTHRQAPVDRNQPSADWLPKHTSVHNGGRPLQYAHGTAGSPSNGNYEVPYA